MFATPNRSQHSISINSSSRLLGARRNREDGDKRKRLLLKRTQGEEISESGTVKERTAKTYAEQPVTASISRTTARAVAHSQGLFILHRVGEGDGGEEDGDQDFEIHDALVLLLSGVP